MLEIVEREAIGVAGCAQAYAVLNGALYVLGAGQHGLGWRDKSRGLLPRSMPPGSTKA